MGWSRRWIPSGIRQVFPVIGSFSATSLYYAGGYTAIVGVQGNTSAFLNCERADCGDCTQRRGGIDDGGEPAGQMSMD